MKLNNRKKNLINQKLRDINVEITESRDRWKKRSKELRKEFYLEKYEFEQRIQSQAAHLAPPNQRTKSCFLNIEILVQWSVDVILALENPKHPDKALLEKYCCWIRRYKALIERLKQFTIITFFQVLLEKSSDCVA